MISGFLVGRGISGLVEMTWDEGLWRIGGDLDLISDIHFMQADAVISFACTAVTLESSLGQVFLLLRTTQWVVEVERKGSHIIPRVVQRDSRKGRLWKYKL